MTEVKGRVLQQQVRGRIFGGVGAEQLAALFGRNAVVFVEADDASPPNLLDWTPVPGSVLPNTSGENTLFIGRLPADRPPEAGMQARVAGVSAEFFQFLTLNDDPIPEGAYDQGDYAVFIRNGEGG